MTILGDVLAELFGMFVSDARMSAAVLAVVAVAAALIGPGGLPPLVGGAVLLLGCMAVLLGAVAWTARRQKAARASQPS
jgi:fatty acid desaturase